MNTNEDILVEASASDDIWGAGIAVNDPTISNPSLWRGSNILGWALMQVRSTINYTESFVLASDADPTCEGWVDSVYTQETHSRVRKYYLPGGNGPKMADG